jgi:hypothetical protein
MFEVSISIFAAVIEKIEGTCGLRWAGSEPLFPFVGRLILGHVAFRTSIDLIGTRFASSGVSRRSRVHLGGRPIPEIASPLVRPFNLNRQL